MTSLKEYTASFIFIVLAKSTGNFRGFGGILKRERYYCKRFASRKELVQMIEDYIIYYNNHRVQRNLGVLTPMEKHCSYPLAA